MGLVRDLRRLRPASSGNGISWNSTPQRTSSIDVDQV
jgi:hypothetical protein